MSRRNVARRKDADAITVLGRQGLGSKAQLVIVQTEDARYVLAVTEHRVDVVDRLPVRVAAEDDSTQPDEQPPRARSFDRALVAASGSTPLEPPYPLRARRRQDPLRGSILSGDTWRQTAEALRRAR